MWKIKDNKKARFFSLFLALVMVTASFASCGKKEAPETTAAPTVATTAAKSASGNPLTGESDYDTKLIGNRPVIISVENHPAARPQWGLTSSDIVMEMVAEGGITRMLLMYADASRIPEKVGPVRSARHYFIELVEGFDAIFVHWGGSTYAYQELSKGNCDDLDGKSITTCFFRDKTTGRDVEHTGYTTGESIIKAIADKEYRTKLESDYLNPFKFNSSAKALTGGDCTECTVSFSSAFTYTYEYDKEKNVYLSSLNGDKFVDSDGNQQSFSNLLIIYAKITDLNDSKSRVTFDLTKGEGVYVSNGTYEEITWKKGDNADMLKFYDKDGKELSLNTGKSYIGIVGTDRESQTVIK